MNPLNLLDRSEAKAGETQPLELEPQLDKQALFKTMIEAKKKRLNYARWRKAHGGLFGISGAEGLKYWEQVK